MKILLSAYACEPNKGSEPGVGWRWANGLAGRVHLTILTRTNNRESIETAISALPADHPLRSIHFLYHDSGKVSRWLKRRRLIPTLAYYFLWQWTAARRFASVADASDVVHHLTFCTALCPGFWNHIKAERVIGPVAAPLVPGEYLPLFGPGRLAQTLRNHLIRNFLKLPWLRKSFIDAAAVVPANSDMKALLADMGVRSNEVMLDTGAPDTIGATEAHATSPASPVSTPNPSDSCVFLYAGVLERRKGLELTLRAFAKAIKDQFPPVESLKSIATKQQTSLPKLSLVLLGDGPDRSRLKTLADTLGIADHVHFLGHVPHDQVAGHFQAADVFIFTSVRDASAGVNLEAMAHGLPIICIAHQGVGDITDDACAIRIEPGSISITIKNLAGAIVKISGDPSMRHKLGNHARQRALTHFSWSQKFSQMIDTYETILQDLPSD